MLRILPVYDILRSKWDLLGKRRRAYFEIAADQNERVQTTGDERCVVVTGKHDLSAFDLQGAKVRRSHHDLCDHVEVQTANSISLQAK